jgi:4-methyl-5(b-hydroxyethyl)-thiazole monophosphate biosynthesis
VQKKVLILLADGFEEIEAVTCIDVLRRANLNVVVVSVGEKEEVCGSHNLKIQTDMKLRNFKELPDVLVLPGGMPGAENLAKSKEVITLIRECDKEKRIIAAICASPAIVLAPLGILDGKRATCYPQFEDNFGAKTAYVDEKVVVDDNIITSQGPGTAPYFALEIVKQLQGQKVADMVRGRALIK